MYMFYNCIPFHQPMYAINLNMFSLTKYNYVNVLYRQLSINIWCIKFNCLLVLKLVCSVVIIDLNVWKEKTFIVYTAVMISLFFVYAQKKKLLFKIVFYFLSVSGKEKTTWDSPYSTLAHTNTSNNIFWVLK